MTEKIRQYRKKPLIIKAVQWNGRGNYDIAVFLGGNDWKHKPATNTVPEHLVIKTLEGEINASLGDWIIKGIKGEFYPCKPDIFERTYELYQQPESTVQPEDLLLTDEEMLDALTDLENKALSCEDIRWNKVSTVIAKAQLSKINIPAIRADERARCQAHEQETVRKLVERLEPNLYFDNDSDKEFWLSLKQAALEGKL